MFVMDKVQNHRQHSARGRFLSIERSLGSNSRNSCQVGNHQLEGGMMDSREDKTGLHRQP